MEHSIYMFMEDGRKTVEKCPKSEDPTKWVNVKAETVNENFVQDRQISCRKTRFRENQKDLKQGEAALRKQLIGNRLELNRGRYPKHRKEL